MRTVAIITAKPVTQSDLRAFAIESGGEWREDYGIQQGVVDRNGGTVLVTLENETLFNGDEADRAEHKAMLGSEPRSYIVIGVIWRAGSRTSIDLAKVLAEQIARRWSGVVDWGELQGEA